ncbi:response regulator transcription factor [Geomonas sp. RF6]|uniref:response regulator n=1 Tax=Geomonas sp. RF6 TaxID=2897342 RepID=UPI001E5B3F6E|nr:response regulator transcription factor [Geomonas sp. RF6]UFS68937.1 response regulator transcription factor [Geomonas sp. RF6]
MSITIVLADDHPLLLNGLSNLFRMEEDLEVVACCSNGVEAMDAIREHRPDVAVLDIRMPKLNGLDAARQILEEKLCPRVVLLTAALEEEQTLEALRIGVHGLLLKEMTPHLVVQCIRKVYAGEQWVEHASVMQALGRMLQRENAPPEACANLTPRELDIVRLVSRGLRNKEIAEKFCLSEGTVKVHLHNIYEKVKVNGRVALLRHAQERGLV